MHSTALVQREVGNKGLDYGKLALPARSLIGKIVYHITSLRILSAINDSWACRQEGHEDALKWLMQKGARYEQLK
jgi:hypothetical protein